MNIKFTDCESNSFNRVKLLFGPTAGRNVAVHRELFNSAFDALL